MSDNLQALIDAPENTNVLVSYNGKVVEMSYLTPGVAPGTKLTAEQLQKQFKLGCQKIRDNVSAGGIGYARTPRGLYYEISLKRAMATPIYPNSSVNVATE